MKNFENQLSIIQVLHDIESFEKSYNINLLVDKKSALMEQFKYYNSERQLRVYIPKILHSILQKDNSFKFYIFKTEIVQNENNTALYLKIEVDFFLENNKKISFTIDEIKEWTKAKYLPFNKFEHKKLLGDYLFAKFGFLTIIAERNVLKIIKSNPQKELFIDIFENKNNIILRIE